MEKIQGIEGTRITRIYSAKFYFFKYVTYNSTHPDFYYDMFPLIFTLGKVPKSKGGAEDEGGGGKLIRGLNFHYIPPKMRLPLLNELRSITPDLHRNPVAFARFFRPLLWRLRKYRPARVCYRHYDIKHIRGGKVLRIHKDNWDKLLMTPRVEHFVTSTFGKYASERVWKNSLREMRKSGTD